MLLLFVSGLSSDEDVLEVEVVDVVVLEEELSDDGCIGYIRKVKFSL